MLTSKLMKQGTQNQVRLGSTVQPKPIVPTMPRSKWKTLPVQARALGSIGRCSKGQDLQTKSSGATVEIKLYCSEQANEATQAFSIGAIATAEDLLIGHWAACPRPYGRKMSPVSQHHFVNRITKLFFMAQMGHRWVRWMCLKMGYTGDVMERPTPIYWETSWGYFI